MKKAVASAVAVLLAVTLSVSSAFALSPAFTRVSMPDPYGVMLLSLDDNSSSRTLSSSGSFWFGKQGSASEIQAFTKVYDNFSSPAVVASSSQSSAYSTFAYNIPAGRYFDFTSSVSYSTSDYQKLLVSGSVQFYLRFTQLGGSLAAYPDRAQFTINGLPVGEPVSISSELFIFPSMEIELSSDVSTIGYRFFYDTAKTGNKTGTLSDTETTCYIYVTDDVSVTPLEVDDPYIPILTSILSWVQNIFNYVSPINSTLLRIESALESLGGEDGSLARLASVFARDDDIQLRDDMDPVLQEATSIFYDSGSNPETAVSADTVTEAGETLKGMSSMFDSGYDATDAFQEIADSKDDFLSWFSEDTSSWLDTTVSTYSREPDPFNHWMIENQYSEMEKKRGGG